MQSVLLSWALFSLVIEGYLNNVRAAVLQRKSAHELIVCWRLLNDSVFVQ